MPALLLLCAVLAAGQDTPVIPPGTVVPTAAPTVAENETVVDSNETVVEDKPQVAFPDIMGESEPFSAHTSHIAAARSPRGYHAHDQGNAPWVRERVVRNVFDLC